MRQDASLQKEKMRGRGLFFFLRLHFSAKLQMVGPFKIQKEYTGHEKNQDHRVV